MVSHPLPLEYDSLAALRRHIAATQRPVPDTAPLPEPASGAGPAPVTTPPAESAQPPKAAVPPPAHQLPAGYEAVPVAGYLVLEPGSDQARFVVVDSRAGQTLMMRTSLTPGPADAADESDDRLRQMLETIVEESRSNIAVADGGEGASTAHERFRQVRRAVTDWFAHQEADETDESNVTESRSEEAAGAAETGAAPRRPASHSSVDVRPTTPAPAQPSEPSPGHTPPEQRSVSPSDITLSEVAHSQEWHEPRPGSALSDRARSADARRRRSLSRGGEVRTDPSDRGSQGSASSAEEPGTSLSAKRPYY